MDELVKMVSDQAGIPESAAEKAVEIILGQLKGKLPAPLAGQLEGVLAGDVDAKDLIGGGGLSSILKMFGGGK